MTAENRVLALELAIDTIIADGAAIPADQAAEVTTTAQLYYRFLEGPVFLVLTTDSITYEQAEPEGPGQTTVRNGVMVQLTDIQQVQLQVAEQDTKSQPVTTDALAWSVDDANVIAITVSADTQSCLCVAGTVGTATVTVTDNSVSPALTGTESFTVVSSAATSLVINAGTPEDQPPPA